MYYDSGFETAETAMIACIEASVSKPKRSTENTGETAYNILSSLSTTTTLFAGKNYLLDNLSNGQSSTLRKLEWRGRKRRVSGGSELREILELEVRRPDH